MNNICRECKQQPTELVSNNFCRLFCVDCVNSDIADEIAQAYCVKYKVSGE